MAKALEYPVVFKALLGGGYITSTHYVQRKTEYKVFQRRACSPPKLIGHITERQFEALMSQGIIMQKSQRRLKGEVIINFYDLTD